MTQNGFRVGARAGCLLTLLAFGGLLRARTQTLVGNSPFMPAGKGGGAAAAANEAYELAGSAVFGADVSVCIYERQAKRSQWIAVGDTVDGVRVVSFDPANDMAVVSVLGANKELSLRKASSASAPGQSFALRSPPSGSSQAAFTAPAAPAAASTPETAAQEQREARMLVSDLLEIGLQQRKAYQDAKQKSASEPPPQPAN
jgi:hypothetical protein